MANKTLGTRQKMVFRVPLSARSVKPLDSIVAAAKQPVAGAHQKSASAPRHGQPRRFKQILVEPESE